MNSDQLTSAFRNLDANHDGFVTLAEIKSTLQRKGISLDDEGSLDTTFHALDRDGDGKLSSAEFHGFGQEPHKTSFGPTLTQLA